MCNSLLTSERLWLDLVLWLGIHAGFPGVLGHPRQGEEQEEQPTEKEQGERRTCAGERPRVVVLYPDRVLAVNHPLHRLPHDLH